MPILSNQIVLLGGKMLKNTEKVLNSELTAHVFQDIDLANLFGGSPARRYALVNKSLKAKELIRLRRGLYMLAPKYQTSTFSSYYLANHIVPYSFVTAESALQFHQLIPERTSQVTSIAAFGRNNKFENILGQFIYFVPNVKSAESFFTGVKAYKLETHLVWIATPLRALVDYIVWHKINNANLEFLRSSLRLEEEFLNTIKKRDIKELISVYSGARVIKFLKTLLNEVNT